jgi:hypothetical protein
MSKIKIFFYLVLAFIFYKGFVAFIYCSFFYIPLTMMLLPSEFCKRISLTGLYSSE